MAKVLLSTLLGERRMAQSTLSKLTGIRNNTIHELYHDITVSVKFEHLDLICKALNCSLTELVKLDPSAELNGTPYQAPPPRKKNT
jgi:putative transcriptional regulator